MLPGSEQAIPMCEPAAHCTALSPAVLRNCSAVKTRPHLSGGSLLLSETGASWDLFQCVEEDLCVVAGPTLLF